MGLRCALAITAACVATLQAAPASAGERFLQFPLTEQVSGAAQADAVLWSVDAGAQTSIQFAAAPKFAAVTLFSKSDEDGQPISAVALSPDGRLAVFQTAATYGGEHTYNPAGLLERPQARLWIVATRSGSEPREIGPGAGAEFSPDGRLVYRHEGNLYIVAFDEAAPRPPVVVKGGARFENIEWLADGASFVFAEDRGGYSVIGKYRLGADRVEWILSEPDRLTSPAVSPDGRLVAYRRFAGREHSRTYDQTQHEPFSIETVELASHDKRVWWQTRVPAASADDDGELPRWIGNDRLIFRSEHDGWDRLYIVAAGGGAPLALSRPDCEVAESELLAPATLAVVHNCDDIDGRQLSLIDIGTGRATAVARNDRVIASPQQAGERYLAFVGGSADTPPLLRVLDRHSGKIVFEQRSADFGWRSPFQTPPPTLVRLESGGLTIHAQLFLPKARGPHPALIYVHGGPQRQMYPAFHFSRYYANVYAANREFAQRGYAVLSVNYRSGTGYGRDFREAGGRGWRAASEYADVVAAARYLSGRSEVDAARIGIWGGSYGGLLTAQALARDSAIFKAGVAVHGVFDWSWPSVRPAHLNPSHFFGVGEQDRATALASSPLGAIDGWRSPVLLFSGDEDANVDVLETVDLTQKLRARGVDVQTIIVPGEAHSFVRHSTWELFWQHASSFFDSRLRNTAASQP
ncbi:MAG: prolyl oligopeptidase family serine peptidase [Steroidobacteraceae bacterium]